MSEAPQLRVNIPEFLKLLERELGKDGVEQLNADGVASLLESLMRKGDDDPELLDIADAAMQKLQAPGVTKKIDVDAVSDLLTKLDGVNLSRAQDALPTLLEFFRSETAQNVFQRAKPVKPIRNTWLPPGRNDDCPCGSGKKFKKCHIHEQQQLQELLKQKATEVAQAE